MTYPTSLNDDEALWFPVSMSGSDSFSRPTGVDGAPPVSASGDDIGAPRPRGPGGPQRPRKSGVRASSWLWLTLWGATAAGVVAYAARREIAAEMVQGWLAAQGAHARAHFDTLTLSHAEGSLLIGPADKPDFSLDRFDIDYRLTPFARGGLPLAQVTRVHLVHPVMQASFTGGRLHFGSLDKLVDNVLSAPPSKAPPPRDVIVEDAMLRLTTDYGALRGRGALSLHDGRLAALNLSLPATHLSGPRGEGDLNGAQILARAVATAQNGEQLHIQAHLNGDGARFGGASPVETVDAAADAALDDFSVSLDLLAPYRKSKAFFDAFSGAAEARITLHAGHAVLNGADIGGVDAALALAGALQSGEKAGGFNGAAQLDAQARTVTAGDWQATQARLHGDKLALKAAFAAGAAPTLIVNGPMGGGAARLTTPGLDARDVALDLGRVLLASDEKGAQADFEGRAAAGRLAAGDAALMNARLKLNGEARSNAVTGGWRLSARGDLDSDAHYGGLDAAARGRAARVPVTGSPTPEQPADAIVALDRAFDRFHLSARGLSLDLTADDAVSAPALRLRLKGGAEAALNGGGHLGLTADGALYDSHGRGGFTATLGGPGLPQAKLIVAGLTPEGGGDWTLSAQGDVAPVAGARFDGHGHFASTQAGFGARLSEPAAFTAASAEIGDHLTGLSARLLPVAAPLLSVTAQGWRAEAGFDDLKLRAPNEQAGFAAGQGAFAAFAIPGADATGLKASLTTGLAGDTLPAEKKRFYPLEISGALTQDARVMTGRFTAATPNAKGADGKALPVAQIDLVNGVASGKGTLKIRTLGLDFAPGGLQPGALTPMTGAASQVTGKATFDGGFDWDAQTVTSGGTLTLDGLTFLVGQTAARGLNGRIDFTSLSPLQSAPHQHLSVAAIDAGLPLSDMSADMQFLGDHVALEDVHVTTPGGPVRLEPMDLPLDDKPMRGAVAFDGLDFGRIVAATSLSSSMSFEGRLSGRLPFTIADGRATVSDGHVAADAPGRISIRRGSVSGVAATGDVTSENVAPATAALARANAEAAVASDPNFNPFQDLAYQALEHLVYTRLEGTVNSHDGALEGGFTIKGYFDPPQKQKASIGLFDYISGRWLKKPITLPSGTPIELHLDVPLGWDGDLFGLKPAADAAK